MSPEDYEEEYKGKNREKKLAKKKNKMRENSRGLKTVILPILKEKARKSDFNRMRVTGRLFKTYQFEI